MGDATIEEVYGGILSYLADNSNKIGFPELVTPMIFQVKDFLKKCKVPNYTKKMKTLLDKTIANQKFIETRRKSVAFSMGDAQKIQIWETQVGRDGTPLLAFYNNWKKITDIQHAKKLSDQEKMDDYSHIPLLKKNHKKLRMKKENSEEVKGFLSGSDDDDFDETEKETRKQTKTKEVEVCQTSDDDDEEEGDEVEDLKLEDLESGADSDSDMEMDDEFNGKESNESDQSDKSESDVSDE